MDDDPCSKTFALSLVSSYISKLASFFKVYFVLMNGIQVTYKNLVRVICDSAGAGSHYCDDMRGRPTAPLTKP